MRAGVVFAALNRWIAYVLIVIGVVFIVVGVYLGLFAWINDGFIVGIRLFSTAGAFGAGLGTLFTKAVGGPSAELTRSRLHSDRI